MHYWNQDNFEGLLRLAEALESDERLSPLADYCRFRERGLRREAFAALDTFLSAARLFDRPVARASAIRILEASGRTPETHQFLTEPLLQQFLLPTLSAWAEEDRDAHIPVRWLGILESDRDLLARALSLCPGDLPVRMTLIGYALDYVAHATHHLDESCFIGTIDEASCALQQARVLIAEAPKAPGSDEALSHVASEVQQFECLLADWKSYCEDPRGSFPEWCAGQGRDYDYPVKVYYQR